MTPNDWLQLWFWSSFCWPVVGGLLAWRFPWFPDNERMSGRTRSVIVGVALGLFVGGASLWFFADHLVANYGA